MPTLDFVDIRRPTGLGVVQLHDELWRVTTADGDVLGYVERFTAPAGQRFRAKRFLARQRRFMVDGEFWAMNDALACFRG
ncbi:hypothetical protein [Marisediminicola sp. LYQ134]|uniref:hypothetical protein n=1 Tax=unclassified Marisediminicola TaxID=2618316 RepID=UPI0039837F28